MFSYRKPTFNQSVELNPIRPCLNVISHCNPYEEMKTAVNMTQEEYNCLERKCKGAIDYVNTGDIIYKNRYCQKCSLPVFPHSPISPRIPSGFFLELVNYQKTGDNVFVTRHKIPVALVKGSKSAPRNNQTINGSVTSWNTSLNSTTPSNSTEYITVEDYDATIAALALAGSITTTACCVVLFLTYALFKEKRTIPGLCIMSYVFALAAAHVLLTAGINQVTHWAVCTGLGVCLHFFFLSHFTWSNIISYDLLKRFGSIKSALRMSLKDSSRSSQYQSFALYSSVAWGVPFIVCLITLILDLKTSLDVDYATDKMCWIQPVVALLYSVIIPIGLALAINLVSFIVLCVSIRRTMKSSQAVTESGYGPATFLSKFWKEVRVFAGIFSLLGLQWIFGLLAAWKQIDWMWYLLIAATPLQGVILVSVYVLNWKTRRLYGELFTRVFSKCCSSRVSRSRKSAMDKTLEGKTTVNL